MSCRSCSARVRAPSPARASQSAGGSDKEHEMAKWLKTTDCIRFDVVERVARITLNRPDKRNTLTPQALAELHAALLEADDRTDVHAIVLAGAGKDFCAGYDLAGAYAGQGSDDGSSYRTVNANLDDDC